jgi:protein disulfide-isomerase
MKVDIWSDVRCPFCYIGKRKFEEALAQFPHKDEIEVVWHSFELDPSLKTDPTINSLEYLARRKGMSLSEVQQMAQHVASAAQEAGLSLDSGNTLVANTFNAHRLIQMAQTRGLAGEAQEHLFQAFFTDGQNIDDARTLAAIGASIGLEQSEVDEMLSSTAYDEIVRQDESQAQSLGINGVPFFVFDNKYAISGAQPPAAFLQALQQSWDEQPGNRKL